MIYLSPADYSVVDADFPDAIPLLASWRGGRILMMGRATSREVMHSTLVQAELMFLDLATGQMTYGRDVDVVEEQPYDYDPRSADMPPIQINEAEQEAGGKDAEGNWLIPRENDPRYHANILLGPGIVARGTWKAPLINYALHGQLVTDKNREELAYVMNGVELIDPDSIRSPANVWS